MAKKKVTKKKVTKKKATKKKGVTRKKAKTVKLGSGSKRSARRVGNVDRMTSDLNIVLGAKEINAILEHIVGKKGKDAGAIFDPGSVAINGGGCCVDASVGSSVIGPVSSVGSSVSVVDPTLGAAGSRASRLERIRTTMRGADMKVTIPANLKVR
ncbi:MAG: hypothetical protein H6730_30680 [Deltaproteobacteria bacterium]|nr:hypothetical protein [Deltaproteobacteria bacterium]